MFDTPQCIYLSAVSLRGQEGFCSAAGPGWEHVAGGRGQGRPIKASCLMPDSSPTKTFAPPGDSALWGGGSLALPGGKRQGPALACRALAQSGQLPCLSLDRGSGHQEVPMSLISPPLAHAGAPRRNPQDRRAGESSGLEGEGPPTRGRGPPPLPQVEGAEGDPLRRNGL